MTRIMILLGLLSLAACGDVKPATPGHEPPSGGTYNPISGTSSNGH